MFVRSRDEKWFSMVTLFLVVTGVCGSESNETLRLKVLSESLDTSNITQIRGLIDAGADVNVRNKFGVTPLFMASQDGHKEVVQLLLGAKADVNAKASVQGKDYTPLSVAKRKGHHSVVKLLKEYGAKE